MVLKNLFDRLRRFDAYPKTLEDFRVKTYGGAVVTLVSGVIMSLLFLSELRDYMTPELTEQLFVDTSRGHKLRINVDLVFPHISCGFLGLDAMDVSGEQHLHIEHNIYKRRLDKDGTPIEEPVKTEQLGSVASDIFKQKKEDNETTTQADKCGSCFGAESILQECCNTCEEVREAYRKKGWAIPNPDEIAQCKEEGFSEKIKATLDEGCQIYGYMEVNRVGGSFHVAPGKSFSINHVHVHDVQPFSSSSFNMTHIIRHLSFGKNIPGKTNPMDDTRGVAEEGAMMFTYYIKIVPTTYVRKDGATLHTNQFSATRHQKVVSVITGESGMPGVFFSYEISPMMVKYSEKEKSFGHFATSVCAIIGGVFTVAGLVDAAIYHSTKAIQKKIEIGKAN